MKTYSDNAVSPADLENLATTVQSTISELDAKQTRKIERLQRLLIAAYAVNALLVLTIYFVR